MSNKEITKTTKINVMLILAFLVYCISLIVVAAFHEPWLDEAEAWQIARCASIKDLFFMITHYEGHPTLWYLILAIPAKLGMPYEFSLKAISCCAAMISAGLILFCSPFPKWFRILLPFHYFLFYQYGVVARPYSICMVCFWLMAMAFEQKDQKPMRFILPMMVLCAMSGYGIVLAGGIAIAWVWQICREKQWKLFTKAFWKDQRIIPLFLLLLCAMFIIWQIMPSADAYATSRNATNPLPLRLIYTFFMMLPDSTILTILQGAAYLSMAKLSAYMIIMGIVVGGLMLSVIVLLSEKKKFAFFVIPYTLFAIFAAIVYFCAHHMGMILCFAIFYLWIIWSDPQRGSYGKALAEKLKLKDQDRKSLSKLGMAGAVLLIGMAIYWNIGASFLDITQPYYYGREVAAFLKETGLWQEAVISEYDIRRDQNENGESVITSINTELTSRAVAIVPYFEHNFVKNLGYGSDDHGYVIHRVPSDSEVFETLRKWREMGLPAVLIGPVDVNAIFGEQVKETRYVAVYKYEAFPNIWKAFTSSYNIQYDEFIYVREDLLSKYHLTELR